MLYTNLPSMRKIALSLFLFFNASIILGQQTSERANIRVDCSTDFWTITAYGDIQQWSFNNGIIVGGDTIVTGGGASLSYCGNRNSPTFYTDNWNPGEIGINYYDADSGWINIPTMHYVQDNGGHLNDQYFTVVGAVIQYVNYWDGINLTVIDSLPGEFFVGIFDIAVDTAGHAWISTGSAPGTSIDSLKVYDKNGQINSYSLNANVQGYGSFFLNGTLYFGTLQDSIFPVIINGNTAQLGIGIPFPSSNFSDMASCQATTSIISVVDQLKPKIELFPNPTLAYINLPSNIEISNVSVYNSIGQLIDYQFNGSLLNLTKQPSGIYYVTINARLGVESHTIIKR
jgi:hypothetical protein